MKRAVIIVCLLGAACGSDDNAPGSSAHGKDAAKADYLAVLDETVPPYTQADAKPLLRVDLRRVDDEVSLAQAKVVETKQLPLPSATAEYLVVAYAEDEVVSAVATTFPRTRSSRTFDDEMHFSEDTVELSEATATAFLAFDPSIDRVALLAPDGTSTDLHNGTFELDSDVTHPSRPFGPVPDLALTSQALSLFGYPNVEIIDTTQRDRVSDADLTYTYPPTKETSTGIVADPTSEHLTIVNDAFAKFPPALVSSVTTLIFAHWPRDSDADHNLYAQTFGGTVIINIHAVKDPLFRQALVHEAAHAFENLTDAQSNGSASKWPADAVAKAAKALQDYGLVHGIGAAWSDIHKSGTSAGVASEYVGDKEGLVLASQEAIRKGFASGYGATNAGEDFAEFVATTVLPADEEPGVCPLFKNLARLDASVAIPYAKLVLLRGVGAVPAADFDRCVGNIAIPTQRGVHFLDSISFEGNMRSWIHADDDGAPTYELIVQGENSYIFDMSLSVRAPAGDGAPSNAARPHSALGLHRLNSVGSLLFAPGSVDSVFIYHDSPFKARTSVGGMVLVTNDSEQHAEGILLGVPFQSPTGSVTDRVMYGSYHFD